MRGPAAAAGRTHLKNNQRENCTKNKARVEAEAEADAATATATEAQLNLLWEKNKWQQLQSELQSLPELKSTWPIGKWLLAFGF